MILAIAVAFVAGTLVSGAVAFADEEKITKLTKQCSKEPKTPDKIKPVCELLNLINAIEDGGGETQTLLCPEGTFMIGIVTGDDDDGDGIIELILCVKLLNRHQ